MIHTCDNGKLAVQDASARLNPINGSLTYSQLRKYGKVVTISFRLTDCDIPYGTVICTLPEGYIPSTTWISIFGQVYDGSSWISGSITIDLGGNIRQEIMQMRDYMFQLYQILHYHLRKMVYIQL